MTLKIKHVSDYPVPWSLVLYFVSLSYPHFRVFFFSRYLKFLMFFYCFLSICEFPPSSPGLVPWDVGVPGRRCQVWQQERRTSETAELLACVEPCEGCLSTPPIYSRDCLKIWEGFLSFFLFFFSDLRKLFHSLFCCFIFFIYFSLCYYSLLFLLSFLTLSFFIHKMFSSLFTFILASSLSIDTTQTLKEA